MTMYGSIKQRNREGCLYTQFYTKYKSYYFKKNKYNY